MKTRINLYASHHHPQFIWITLSHMFLLCICALLLITGVGYWLNLENTQGERELKLVTARSQQHKSTFDEITVLLNERQEDPVLVSKRDELSFDLSQKNQLVAELKRLGQFQEASFSSLFNSLAEINSPELWITELKVLQLNMKISGRLSTPSALPSWVRSLSNTEYFRQRAFKETQVNRIEGGLAFSLSTTKTEEWNSELKK